MRPQTFHLHLSGEGDEIVVRILEAPFRSGAVARCPRPRHLGTLAATPPPAADPPRRAQRRRTRDFHSACELPGGGKRWRGPGALLFEAIFRGEVGEAYDLALAAKQPLRLVLEFAPSEDRRDGLQSLPWESLYDPDRGRFLAASPPHSLVRFIPPGFRAQYHPTGTRLRLLVVASHAGPGPLDLDEELRRLRRALRWQWWLSVEVLRDPTPARFFRCISSGGFQVLHFMGHGALRGGEGALFLRGEGGQPVAVSAAELAAGIVDPANGRTTLRLAFLNACEGARHENLRPFSALATALVRAGVPAVVAMQQPIRDTDAILFSTSLYDRLIAGVPTDRAVAEGRRELAFHQGLWWAPVLYSRLEDGRLFAASPARRWLPRIAAAVLAIALVAAAWIAIDSPQPARPVSADFPRSAENQDVRVTMPVPCSFLEQDRETTWTPERAALHCWFTVDLLGPLPTTLPLAGETRFVDNDGREYFVQQAWLDGEPFAFEAPSRQHELSLPIVGEAHLEVAFDVSRLKRKAADVEIVLGSDRSLHFGEFRLDRD